MQQRISADTIRYPQDAGQHYDQSTDHPERMLFYATFFGILSWAIIGLISWGVWRWL